MLNLEVPRIYAIAFCVVVAIAMAAIATDPPKHFTVEASQLGPVVVLSWEAQEGACLYEVQMQDHNQEWLRGILVLGDGASFMVMPGVARYRVRPWFPDGPHAWSPATPWLYFLPRPAPPVADPDGPEPLPDTETAGVGP